MSIIRDDDDPVLVIGFVITFALGAAAFIWLTM